jgi:hypothetical protein
MPAYNTEQLRAFIDDLDAVLRRGVTERKLKEVFREERGRIVRNLFLSKFFCLIHQNIGYFDERSQGMPKRPGPPDNDICTPVRVAIDSILGEDS